LLTAFPFYRPGFFRRSSPDYILRGNASLSFLPSHGFGMNINRFCPAFFKVADRLDRETGAASGPAVSKPSASTRREKL